MLLQHLSTLEAQLVSTIASDPEPPTLDLYDCVREIKRARYERERAAVHQEIDRLQRNGASQTPEMNALFARVGELGRAIQALVLSEE